MDARHPAAKALLDFIASIEAPRGYDTVYGNKMALMPKPLTTMTVDEVIKQGNWRYKTFGSSAAGSYQIMERTLRGLKKKLRLSGRELFDAALQQRLAYDLLVQRRFPDFLSGALPVTAFGLLLAQEWASMPVLAPTQGQHRQVQRGDSFYRGDKQNKSLVSPLTVETKLAQVRSLAGAAIPVRDLVPVPEPQSAPAPRAPTVVPGQDPAAPLPWWARLVGRRAAPPVSRPGLHPNGSAELYDVQKALRDRSYYTKGKLDGLDGPLTQEAVAQARKDNGLGDGGVDAEFLAALPGMPSRPVSYERYSMGVLAAAKQRPEVFKPLGWLGATGASLLGVGAGDLSGVFGNVQGAADKANDVLASTQSAIGTVTGVIGFVSDHRGWFLLALGLYIVWWVANKVIDAVIKVRAAFF